MHKDETRETPLAAIDIGSNTIHLTVARPIVERDDLVYLADELDLTRLGADVSATGAIGPERMQRAIVVAQHQASIARSYGAATILGIATEGVRTATNGADLLARLRDEAGVIFALISGEQEAALTYWGATSGLEAWDGRRAVLDLGGGSLEIVAGEGRHVLWRVSLPLGSGAIHDRYTPADPPDPDELARARHYVAETLRPLDPPLPVAEVIVCGGTATTLAYLAARALANGDLPASGAAEEADAVVEGRTRYVSRERLERLLDLTRGHRAADIATRYGIEEARARLLAAGAVVLLATMERMGAAALHVRRRGIREGALLAYARLGADWLEAAAQGTSE
jgi:exopolyphosphatase/guanosine-5'-triphosphate,3'-diphosphate pyrophosphatase